MKDAEASKKRKKNTKPHPLKKTGAQQADRERKRTECEERAATWQALSAEQQISLLDLRGHTALKQRKRIDEQRKAKESRPVDSGTAKPSKAQRGSKAS